MGQDIIPELVITKYFLGQLTEQERLQVEERCFTDSVFLERMQAIEAELIEDYVRGTLPKDVAERLERGMVTSSHQRQKVEFAASMLRSLGQEADSASPQVKQVSASHLQPLITFIIKHLLTPRAAFAAVLVAFCLGGWLLWEVIRVRRHLGEVQKEQAAAQLREQALREVIARHQQPSGRETDNNVREPEGEGQSQSTQHTLENINAGERSNRSQRLPGAPRTDRPDSSLAVLSLSPVTVRYGQGPPKQVNISSSTRTVQIQLLYEGEDHPNYQVIIETADGEQVWTKDQLKATRLGGKRAVKVNVSSTLLGRKTYVITLRASSSAGGSEEDIGRYTFKIIKK